MTPLPETQSTIELTSTKPLCKADCELARAVENFLELLDRSFRNDFECQCAIRWMKEALIRVKVSPSEWIVRGAWLCLLDWTPLLRA